MKPRDLDTGENSKEKTNSVRGRFMKPGDDDNSSDSRRSGGYSTKSTSQPAWRKKEYQKTETEAKPKRKDSPIRRRRSSTSSSSRLSFKLIFLFI